MCRRSGPGLLCLVLRPAAGWPTSADAALQAIWRQKMRKRQDLLAYNAQQSGVHCD